MKNTGKWLKETRENAGFTQIKLAQNMSRALGGFPMATSCAVAISKIERGNKKAFTDKMWVAATAILTAMEFSEPTAQAKIDKVEEKEIRLNEIALRSNFRNFVPIMEKLKEIYNVKVSFFCVARVLEACIKVDRLFETQDKTISISDENYIRIVLDNIKISE